MSWIKNATAHSRTAFLTWSRRPSGKNGRLMLKDTQSERDERRMPIDRVGVKSLRYPLQVRDKEHSIQSTVATIQAHR
jgi:hypothetical protein